MSNALAIATVTETLLQVLTKALGASLVTGASVTTLRPDASKGLPESGVNVFLYQVTPNPSWRNADLPTRKANGDLLRRPQIALDLYYLLTFYGDDGAFEQQRLLGAVARALHAQPVLQRSALQMVEQMTDAQNAFYLASHLSEQLDLVRLTPINFSLEEMSKLWSVFLKTDYVLSVAYMASVVLIETDDPPPAPALPVLRPCIQAVPFNVAIIHSVEPQALPVIGPGLVQITLVGQGLSAASDVWITTPGKPEPLLGTVAAGSTSDRLVVSLPNGLRPGVNTVQLVQRASPASPPACSPHVLTQSNIAAFVLLPTLVPLSHSSPTGFLTARVSPPVGPRQAVSLVLNPLAGSPSAGSDAFTLPAEPHSSETDLFSFPTSFGSASSPVPVPPGTYLARARVDGADSRLDLNPAGAFIGPTVKI